MSTKNPTAQEKFYFSTGKKVKNMAAKKCSKCGKAGCNGKCSGKKC